VVISATVPNAAWIVPLWVVGGVCNGGINIFTSVLIAQRAPAAAHGRAFAVLGASVQGGSLFGLMAAGPLVERFEPRALVAALGAAGLLAAVACLPAVRVRPASPGRSEQVRDSVGA